MIWLMLQKDDVEMRDGGKMYRTLSGSGTSTHRRDVFQLNNRIQWLHGHL